MLTTLRLSHGGFTLVEVLVAVTVMGMGLLGLASMQTLALKDSQDASFYGQAAALAYDMKDRITANAAIWRTNTAAITGITGTSGASCDASVLNTCNSVANSCAPLDMGVHDFCAWKQQVTKKLNSSATVTITTTSGSNSCGQDSTGGTTKRCLIISWSGKTSPFELEVTP